LNIRDIEKKAREMKGRLGGKIFAFPINEKDPFSKYAVSIWIEGNTFNTFPEPLDISEAAAGVNETLKGFKSEGWDSDYERNVRFISHQAQINAPDVTMRRLKKMNGALTTSKPSIKNPDFMERDDGEEGYWISARGLIKFSYFSMIDDKLPRAFEFMDEYYKILSTRRYGKTVVGIKREVKQMDKDEATKWIEDTYSKYIHNDQEVIDIMNKLKTTS
jgi:hypothetical protein